MSYPDVYSKRSFKPRNKSGHKSLFGVRAYGVSLESYDVNTSIGPQCVAWDLVYGTYAVTNCKYYSEAFEDD